MRLQTGWGTDQFMIDAQRSTLLPVVGRLLFTAIKIAPCCPMQTGWDTDQFMTDERETTLLWWTLLRHGGIAPGADSTVNGHALLA